MPEPFYIHNPDTGLVGLPVDPAARFTLLAYDSTGTPVIEKTLSYAELAQLATNRNEDDFYSADFASGHISIPMDITVSEGRATGARELYVP